MSYCLCMMKQNRISLGEGDTPLMTLPRLGAELGLRHLYVKDESLNPTGSFKARGLSAAVSKAKELGVKKDHYSYCGECRRRDGCLRSPLGYCRPVFICLKILLMANMEESRIAGAQVILIDGLISEAAGMAGRQSA